MKLLRYGEIGHERPGMVDNDGVIRDLSGVVDDITGEILLDDNLQSLKAMTLANCLSLGPMFALAPVSQGSASSSALD